MLEWDQLLAARTGSLFLQLRLIRQGRVRPVRRVAGTPMNLPSDDHATSLTSPQPKPVNAVEVRNGVVGIRPIRNVPQRPVAARRRTVEVVRYGMAVAVIAATAITACSAASHPAAPSRGSPRALPPASRPVTGAG